MPSRILVPIDGSPAALEALRVAATMARAFSARLRIITVPRRFLPPPEEALAWESRDDALSTIQEAELRRAQQILDDAAAGLKGSGPDCTTAIVDAEEPYEGILAEAASMGADLIVMGSHGRRGLHRLLLGSQATKVIALSAAPVLVCKAAA